MCNIFIRQKLFNYIIMKLRIKNCFFYYTNIFGIFGIGY
ncbi:hypothetical protein M145_4689, partial [Bacteroides fragilis str. 34-F-2 